MKMCPQSEHAHSIVLNRKGSMHEIPNDLLLEETITKSPATLTLVEIQPFM